MISKRHPHRGLAPSGKLEWKIPGSRRWRFCRLHRLRPSRDFDPWRLCLSEHKHRPRLGGPHRRFLGVRPSRKTHRLRLPRRPSDGCSRQRGHPRTLRQSAAVFLLSRLLQRRPPGLDGSAALSRRFQRYSRRSARELLVASPHQRAVGCAGAGRERCQLHSLEQIARDRASGKRSIKPESMLCKNDHANDCLTEPQIVALKKIYQGPRDASGKQIFPGFLPGGEEGPNGWLAWITGPEKVKSAIGAFTHNYFANIIYENREWTAKSADLAQSVKLADE